MSWTLGGSALLFYLFGYANMGTGYQTPPARIGQAWQVVGVVTCGGVVGKMVRYPSTPLPLYSSTPLSIGMRMRPVRGRLEAPGYVRHGQADEQRHGEFYAVVLVEL
jgi:hypothetical protein